MSPRSAISPQGDAVLPSRIVREGIISSTRINALSRGAELFYRRLMSVADDHGRFHASPITLRGACWPTCPEKVSEQEIVGWLAECEEGTDPIVCVYEHGGASYLCIKNFGQQTRTKSKFPEPPQSPPLISCSTDDNQMLSACEANAQPSRMRIRSRMRIGAPNGSAKQTLNGKTSQRFDEWWGLWERTRGNPYHDEACQAWLSVVTIELEQSAMDCTGTYLAGPGHDPANGYRPDNFLFVHAKNGFSARYKPPKQSTQQIGTDPTKLDGYQELK